MAMPQVTGDSPGHPREVLQRLDDVIWLICRELVQHAQFEDSVMFVAVRAWRSRFPLRSEPIALVDLDRVVWRKSRDVLARTVLDSESGVSYFS
jgi:hypothetical protein